MKYLTNQMQIINRVCNASWLLHLNGKKTTEPWFHDCS